ncbi:hypothetical protein [Methanolobus sp. WCC5]|uniref:hypothetical protein n=1 Tax=Methanolobus sp. WCC5 TaxID=3125785 RepID=UPI00324A4474
MRIKLPLIIFLSTLVWGLYGFIIGSKFSLEIILMSIGALFALLGMNKPEYSRFCKYVTTLFISATAFAAYLSINNNYIAILGIILLLVLVIVDFKLYKKTW